MSRCLDRGSEETLFYMMYSVLVKRASGLKTVCSGPIRTRLTAYFSARADITPLYVSLWAMEMKVPKRRKLIDYL